MSEITLKSVEDNLVEADSGEVMAWDSKIRRAFTVYLPLAVFVFVLLFPFYWMTITAFKSNGELLDYQHNNPF